jgi:glycosyltransferase involved in cell wall biosynthesis
MEQPLVSVILTTYNQEKYVEETLRSIVAQTYPQIQLIVIDNASSDNTVAVVKRVTGAVQSFTMIRNNVNAGLCKAFNQGLSLADGKYVIDLSGDDVFLPNRIEQQVKAFESLPDEYAVVFSNARHITENGDFVKYHYAVDQQEKSVNHIPTGDVYKNVLEKYFICTPTMMIRASVLREMNGFDESLTFEDFDFWVRSAVKYKYFYQDEVLTSKRAAPGSLGTRVYKKKSGMLESYYAVCNKAYDLNRNQEEFDLLAARIRTFIRKCWYAQEFDLAVRFRSLLNYIENPGWKTELIVILCRVRLPVNTVYRFYLKNLHKYFTGREDLALRIVKSES